MNSVQFLRGQLRSVLMVMALGAAHAAVAAEDMKLTPLNQVPLGIEVRGKQVAAYSWDDRQGRNLLVLAEQEASERDDDGTQSASIYAAQYLLEGDRPKRLWMLHDDVQRCEFDASLHFDNAATRVTDLLGDGQSQVTVGYSRTCTSDVSPREFKLIMHIGKSHKYGLRGVDRYGASWWDEEAGALRGMPLPTDCSVAGQQALVSQYKEQGTDLPLPGCYNDEHDFAKAPATLLAFMREQWFVLMQKQDVDWSQQQSLAPAEDEP
ncbi:MAG: M949_RS01915 family surface polysaccharide biosynthesis protein [Pseudomonas proteolytica]|uniref:M949_RS01915 family surface polysaccharide biosynthesis protein n=1 Tax=Pseudomonas proteolytica TaxID=219574 RepID=UPI003F37C1A0